MAVSMTSMRTFDNSIVKLECHDRVESCQAIAREYASEGYADKYAVISNYDYKLGGDEKGVYMSLLLRPSFFPSQAGLLSALSVSALANALAEHTEMRIGIGWVSSIYCEGKHIGGVSIEGKIGEMNGYEYIIINFAVKLSDENFPPRLTDLVKKIFENDKHSVTEIIAKNILNKFFPLYANMRNSTKFMQTYKQRFVLTGHRVKRIKNGKKKSMRVLGVRTEDCALLLESKAESYDAVTSPQEVIIPKSVRLPKPPKQTGMIFN